MIISAEWCRGYCWAEYQSEVTAQAIPKVMWDSGVEFIACFHESSSMLASPNTILNLLKRLVTCLDLCHCQLPCRPRQRSDSTTIGPSWKLYLWPCPTKTHLSTFKIALPLPPHPHTTSHPNFLFLYSVISASFKWWWWQNILLNELRLSEHVG